MRFWVGIGFSQTGASTDFDKNLVDSLDSFKADPIDWAHFLHNFFHWPFSNLEKLLWNKAIQTFNIALDCPFKTKHYYVQRPAEKQPQPAAYFGDRQGVQTKVGGKQKASRPAAEKTGGSAAQEVGSRGRSAGESGETSAAGGENENAAFEHGERWE